MRDDVLVSSPRIIKSMLAHVKKACNRNRRCSHPDLSGGGVIPPVLRILYFLFMVN